MQARSRRILQQLGIAFGAWTVVAVFSYVRFPLQALAAGREPPPLRPGPRRGAGRALRRDAGAGVRDTGARGASSTPSTRIGLANTRARLAQLYGDRHELALTTDEWGTVAKVVIPFRAQPRGLSQ